MSRVILLIFQLIYSCLVQARGRKDFMEINILPKRSQNVNLTSRGMAKEISRMRKTLDSIPSSSSFLLNPNIFLFFYFHFTITAIYYLIF
jgi:hypothetical protein